MLLGFEVRHPTEDVSGRAVTIHGKLGDTQTSSMCDYLPIYFERGPCISLTHARTVGTMLFRDPLRNN